MPKILRSAGASWLARLTVNTATLLWCGIVLAKPDALIASRSPLAFIVTYVPENVVAALLGALVVAQTAWSVLHWPLVRWHGFPVGVLGYGGLSLWWSFVFLAGALSSGPIYPTSTATSATIAALALYAFISHTKSDAA